MRTTLTIAILITFVVGFMSCKSEAEKMEKQYIEACAEGNFTEARKIVEMMSAEEISSYELDKCWQYVNSREIYSLLEDGSKDASNRIFYLYNTYKKEQMPDMNDVLEVAISQSNEYLAQKLIKGGVPTRLNHAEAAAKAELSEVLNKIVLENPAVLSSDIVGDFYINENGIDEYEELLINNISSIDMTALSKISSKRNLNKLKEAIKHKDAESLMAQYNELSSKSLPSRPQLGTVKSNHYGDMDGDYTRYRNEVTGFNSECMELMRKAAEAGNWQLAEKAIGLMKPNLEWTEIGDWAHVVEHQYNVNSVYNAFKVTISNEEINQARQTLKSLKQRK